MNGVFEVYTDARGEYRFRLKAPNGEILLASEGYKGKAGCLNGIKSVKENCPIDERFEKYEDKAGKHRFRLKAANYQVIGTGEAYESESGLEGGIASIQRWAPDAEIKEL
jgi:uncharacterized protein YegP (UPF0339 family)